MILIAMRCGIKRSREQKNDHREEKKEESHWVTWNERKSND